MSGIGIEFRSIYKRRSLSSAVRGLGYSMVTTLTPMLCIILVLTLMYNVLDYDEALYAERELLSATLMYVFIFSLILSTPFTAPLGSYLNIAVFRKQYERVMPCYYTGLAITMSALGVVAAVFYACVHWVAGVDLFFCLLSFCAFTGMTLVFFNMTFMGATKDLRKVALFFGVGMALCFLIAFAAVKLGMGVTYAILLGLAGGFIIIAALQYAFLRACYPKSDHSYAAVLPYYKQSGLLIAANLLYTLGLFVHNFVYWCTDLQVVVNACYVYAPTYDRASCIAMYTNIMASVLFVTQVEAHFIKRYKEYSDALQSSRLADIELSKNRMFRMVNHIVISVVKLQFITSVGLFLLFMVVLPGIGFYGLTMDIYPCLAAGYFAVYIMYAQLMFLNYFEDHQGSLITGLLFFAGTLIGSILSARLLPYEWQGAGLFAGALLGWTYSCFRLRYIQKHFDAHIFCRGELVAKKPAEIPSSKVFDRATV